MCQTTTFSTPLPTAEALSLFRTLRAHILLIEAEEVWDLSDSFNDFEAESNNFLRFSSDSYKPEILLPENFLVTLPVSNLPDPINLSSEDLSSSFSTLTEAAPAAPVAATPRNPLPSRAPSGDYTLDLNSALPAELSGLPVVEVGGESVVFISHLLLRVLVCQCRARRHFGLFKDKKFIGYRRSIDCSVLKHELHDDPAYLEYRERYPVNRLKSTAAAITVEGLKKWMDSGKMDCFVAREEHKCLQGCIKAECTCEQNTEDGTK